MRRPPISPAQVSAYPFVLRPIVQRTKSAIGQTLALCRDTLIVGSLGNAIDVYQINESTFKHRQRLTTPHTAAAFAADERTLAVQSGAPGRPGAVVLYAWSGQGWVTRSTVVSPSAEPYDNFGQALAISGDTLIATTHNVNPDAITGRAFIFCRQRGHWRMEAELTGEQGDESYGISAALNGDLAVVGAPAYAVYVYRRRQGSWELEARLAKSGSLSGDLFGASVATDGNLIVVSDSSTSGASIFSNTNGEWVRSTAGEGRSTSQVSISAGLVALGQGEPGERGSVLILRQEQNAWEVAQTILPPAGAPAGFGSSLALSNRTLAVSSLDWSTGKSAVYVSERLMEEEEQSASPRLHPTLKDAVRKIGRPAPKLRLLVLTPYAYPSLFSRISSNQMLTWGLRANRIHYTLHNPVLPRNDLQTFDAVLCWAYGFKRFPLALQACHAFEDRARELGIPVVNSLKAFSIAHSSCLRAWTAAGIRCAKYQHIVSADDIQLQYPLILRTDGVHRGRHMHLVRDREEAEAVFHQAALHPEIPKPNLALEFVDTRGVDGYFRKRRSHVVGNTVVPRQAQISTNWIVNLDGAVPLDVAIAEDQNFVKNGEPEPEFLLRAARTMGSEIVALDYTKHGDEYIFWEGNRNFDLSVGGKMWKQFCRSTGRSDQEAAQSIMRLANAIGHHVLDTIATHRAEKNA